MPASSHEEALRSKAFRVVFCGGREFGDRVGMKGVIKSILVKRPLLVIIHGDATGADRMAGSIAREMGIPEAKVPAQWGFYKKGAGPVRNRWMMRLDPELVIAFPGGRGTANMKKQAEECGVEVWEIPQSSSED